MKQTQCPNYAILFILARHCYRDKKRTLFLIMSAIWWHWRESDLRPHQPREVAKYLQSQKRVLAIKPGITGLAQIGGRSDIPFEEEIRLDNYYIEHWTPYLDLIILTKTPFAVFSRKGTY
jgi:hypothetical protein